MQKVSIAGVVIDICSKKTIELHKFKSFFYIGNDVPDVVVHVNGQKDIHVPSGKSVLEERLIWVGETENKITVYISKEDPTQIAYLLHVNNQWDTANIVYSEEGFNAEYAVTGPLGEILFRNRLLFHEGIVLHASSVLCEGKGILFSAPSETGKTTQAKLWLENKGAQLINDDRTAIRIFENKVYAYGTPWSGILSECNNQSAPIAAIIILEQYRENLIIKLNTVQALQRLVPRCFLPYFNQRLMNIAMDNLESLLQRTPVYLLKCRPDIDAVQLVYDTVWKNCF